MEVQVHKYLQLAVVIALTWQSQAWIYGGDFSQSFEQCITIREKGANNVPFTKGVYEKYCTDLLLPVDKNNQRLGNFTSEQMGYIHDLFRKVYTEAYNRGSNRVKRGAKGGGSGDVSIGTRTCIRTYNGRNFYRYADAVNRLKKTGEYDTIAAIHGTVVKTAHFGVNLLPWHRLYLMIMEQACGVPVPYWDSTLDNAMKDPTKSIIWTDKFFGNGIGKVVTGPFANFKTPAGPLMRKIGASGSLFDREGAYNIMRQERLRDISTPFAKPKNNVEGQHNNVHAWVNGHMGNIALSSYDPIFFCFHSFLDFLWDIFRLRESTIGINAETDFVKTNAKGQRPEDQSGIKGFTNFDGYSHRTAKSYSYRFWAQCAYCDGNKYVYCDKKRGVCVSKAAKKGPIPKWQLAEADEVARRWGLASGKFGPPFRPFFIDRRTRADPVQYTEPVKY